tara:strand:- start:175 stop:783 length:609 start_codon:yes stop_codon:yes gene_type:complete
MIAIVDTGGANLFSVTAAFKRLGASYEITNDHKKIKSASKVLLPGVGAAADCMSRIANDDLITLIRELKQPVMGICLGMQILFDVSAEGDIGCLGIIPGKVRAMKPDYDITVPHMGWNLIELCGSGSRSDPLFADLFMADRRIYAYFVHSFCAPVTEYTLATATHGCAVPAVVRKDNFWGCQFHPERSGAVGSRILENFLKL